MKEESKRMKNPRDHEQGIRYVGRLSRFTSSLTIRPLNASPLKQEGKWAKREFKAKETHQKEMNKTQTIAPTKHLQPQASFKSAPCPAPRRPSAKPTSPYLPNPPIPPPPMPPATAPALPIRPTPAPPPRPPSATAWTAAPAVAAARRPGPSGPARISPLPTPVAARWETYAAYSAQ
ncbi:hypothetical protein MPH_03997 [Macrophomina phaseolina MS6]|uniref:Uncharacterized protein n=1 Tax=Macrophomina phaseolina (strain MS6) TaxID=1126212 RepID=K2R8M7_MACPH|nr:hypothetical protein MPH_03997 [Macrophomina phaseolina MS6]